MLKEAKKLKKLRKKLSLYQQNQLNKSEIKVNVKEEKSDIIMDIDKNEQLSFTNSITPITTTATTTTTTAINTTQSTTPTLINSSLKSSLTTSKSLTTITNITTINKIKTKFDQKITKITKNTKKKKNKEQHAEFESLKNSYLLQKILMDYLEVKANYIGKQLCNPNSNPNLNFKCFCCCFFLRRKYKRITFTIRQFNNIILFIH